MAEPTASSVVLVTGASGYIATHCILQLLQQGYHVRGTLRSMGKETELREALARHTAVDGRLEFVQLDLLADVGWAAAMEGCTYVLHVASPVLLGVPKNPDDLILPAWEGTLRVLRAAAAAGVRRIVQTSSVAAINAGRPNNTVPFDETVWSDLSQKISPYSRSKTLAEQAAWEFIGSRENAYQMSLVVINPGLVLGPILSPAFLGSSMEVVRRMLSPRFPGSPRRSWTVVDVRDVAAAHLTAMVYPEAAGKRYICTHETMWLHEIAAVLAAYYGPCGRKIQTRRIPDFLVRIMAVVDPALNGIKDSLGRQHIYTSARLRQELDWQPRPVEETLIDAAESLLSMGFG